MKLFIILRKYLEKSGPWATIWANGPLQILNPKTGLGLGQIDSAQAHSGPKPKNGFTKAQARPGWAWAWPKLIPKTMYLHILQNLNEFPGKEHEYTLLICQNSLDFFSQKISHSKAKLGP